jgi:HTH-type transcriptional regulator/antitoxin HigA
MDNLIRPITDEGGLDLAQAEMGRLLEISERSAAEDDRLGVLGALIRAYEDQHWALEMPDPILAIQSRMDELGLQQSDLLEEFGNKTTASHVMNRKRPLTLPVIRRLAFRLSLPIAVLTQDYPLSSNTETNVGSNNKRRSATG